MPLKVLFQGHSTIMLGIFRAEEQGAMASIFVATKISYYLARATTANL
jgi:hypothetical protein